ncbi:MAG: KamA family radical SAM protein [candidate division Zixibacteria bacterium]|nr:KamA family radical SAM protein [candidate division Zixibacteria bacterium]
MAGTNDHKTTGLKKQPGYIFNIDDIPQLSDREKARLKEVTRFFAFRSNEYYLRLIDWDNPNDPIRRIIIPDEDELNDWGEMDACNERSITVRKGVQHKYASTVLLLVHEVCNSFCRYCFRKRLFINKGEEVSYNIDEGIEYIRQHKEVDNVLLTGGDPLVLPTPRLEKIIKTLREIDHVRIIRLGTKMTAFNPYRFINDPELLEMLAKYSQPDRKIYVVCHYDHPNEITPESREAVQLLQRAGCILTNQNPIIKGISDKPSVMAQLWNELCFMGMPQYYVFQCRPTAGNEPYAVPITEAYFKIEEAKRQCSGLAKRLKYVMSHATGKIEVVGVDDNFIYMRYHRAKLEDDEQKFIVCYRNDEAYWFDHLTVVEGLGDQIIADEMTHRAG